QLLLPCPTYPVGSGTTNGILLQGANFGSSYYGRLNVRLQKRFTHGLTLINNFVWSRLMERTAYLNDSDTAPEKRVPAISRPMQEIVAASYDLPIGHGKRVDFGSRVANGVLGGWALNGTLTLHSGPPLAWGHVIYY